MARALARLSHSLANIMKFSGGGHRPLAPDMNEKNDFVLVETPVQFFAVCGPMFTELSVQLCMCISNAFFLFTISCCGPEIFAIKSQSFPKLF